MNKGLQRSMIEKHLIRLGIEPDLIDIDAKIDSALTFRENLQSIMEDAKSLVHDADMIRLKEAGLNRLYSEKKMKNAIRQWMRWTWNHKETTRPLEEFL
jgi:hypothetical protein